MGFFVTEFDATTHIVRKFIDRHKNNNENKRDDKMTHTLPDIQPTPTVSHQEEKVQRHQVRHEQHN